jgi:hypothetical protein
VIEVKKLDTLQIDSIESSRLLSLSFKRGPVMQISKISHIADP